MKLSRKIFFAVSLTSFLVGTIIVFTAHQYVAEDAQAKFLERYTVVTRVLSQTLTELDRRTENLMMIAAKVVQAKDAELGLTSTPVLQDLRDELLMTHIFVIDKKGKFIRSTNEDPKHIPNLYSFCSDYEKLVKGTSDLEATPVIRAEPEARPYKFVSVPSRDRERILEVGIRVDFISKTLVEAAKADKNIVQMSLYAPNGKSFGRFEPNGNVLFDVEGQFPADLTSPVETKNSFRFFSKVVSSHPRCCQCDVSKTSVNGEYYYVIEAEVSKKELTQVLASTNNLFWGLALLNILLAFGIGQVASGRLVKNIEYAVDRIRDIKNNPNLKGRVDLNGGDEISFLTGEFDRLLDDLDVEKRKALETERLETRMRLAQEVAHNIKSPLVAMQMVVPNLVGVPERAQKILDTSVREIKDLIERLSLRALQGSEDAGAKLDIVHLPTLLKDLVARKQSEYSGRSGVTIQFDHHSAEGPYFANLDPSDMKSILSNLINNAVEAKAKNRITVIVGTSVSDGFFSSVVEDDGVGIPANVLNQVGESRITFKGDKGRGLGLPHASRLIREWGGRLQIDSKLGQGTRVEVQIPLVIDTEGVVAHRGFI